MHIQHLIKSLESLYQEILNQPLIALNLFLPKFFEIVEKVNKNLKMVFKIKLTSIIEEQKATSKSNLIISSGLKCLLSTHMPSFMIEIAQTFIDEAGESQLYANRALAVFDLVVAQIKAQK